jgi:hypothetical protein
MLPREFASLIESTTCAQALTAPDTLCADTNLKTRYGREITPLDIHFVMEYKDNSSCGITSAKPGGSKLSRLTIIILLIITCTGFFGSIHIMANHHSQGLDIEELFSSGWSGAVALLCVTVPAAIARLIVQIKLSAQILFSFFFYGWRNSHYDEGGHNFTGLFPSLETYCGC